MPWSETLRPKLRVANLVCLRIASLSSAAITFSGILLAFQSAFGIRETWRSCVFSPCTIGSKMCSWSSSQFEFRLPNLEYKAVATPPLPQRCLKFAHLVSASCELSDLPALGRQVHVPETPTTHLFHQVSPRASEVVIAQQLDRLAGDLKARVRGTVCCPRLLLCCY